MSNIIEAAFADIEELLGKVPASTVATIGTQPVTWSDLESSTTSIAGYFQAISAAIKAKNLAVGAELSIEEALTIAADLGIGEPFTGILKTVMPLLFDIINNPGELAALFSGAVAPQILATEKALYVRFDPQGDVPRMVPQPPAPAPTEPAPPANEPDMPSGMRPGN